MTHSRPKHAGNIRSAAPSPPLPPLPCLALPHTNPPLHTLLRLNPPHLTPPHPTLSPGAATPSRINHIVNEWMTEQAGAMMLLDLCLLPWPRRGPACLRLHRHAARLLTHRKLHRLLLTLLSLAAYTKLRSWLAGDHLVRIYRKVSPFHSLQSFQYLL